MKTARACTPINARGVLSYLQAKILVSDLNDKENHIDTALSSLRKLVEKVRPEERSMTDDSLVCHCDGEGYCDCNFSENEGYNQAITEYTEKLMEVLK